MTTNKKYANMTAEEKAAYIAALDAANLEKGLEREGITVFSDVTEENLDGASRFYFRAQRINPKFDYVVKNESGKPVLDEKGKPVTKKSVVYVSFYVPDTHENIKNFYRTGILKGRSYNLTRQVKKDYTKEGQEFVSSLSGFSLFYAHGLNKKFRKNPADARFWDNGQPKRAAVDTETPAAAQAQAYAVTDDDLPF